jgi:hypothetical protein
MVIKFSANHRVKNKYNFKSRLKSSFKIYSSALLLSKRIKLVAYKGVNLFLFHIKSAVNYLSKILSLRAKLSRKMIVFLTDN